MSLFLSISLFLPYKYTQINTVCLSPTLSYSLSLSFSLTLSSSKCVCSHKNTPSRHKKNTAHTTTFLCGHVWHLISINRHKALSLLHKHTLTRTYFLLHLFFSSLSSVLGKESLRKDMMMVVVDDTTTTTCVNNSINWHREWEATWNLLFLENKLKKTKVSKEFSMKFYFLQSNTVITIKV